MAVPTTEEKHLLIDFRARLENVLETDNQKKSSFLIRWLRARDLDLKEAEKMLRSSLAWRKANGIDHILELPVDMYFQQQLAYYITGFDKYGHPVILMTPGKVDYRKCIAQKSTAEINHCLENICRAIENANEGRDPNVYPVTQFTLIVDWNGFSYKQICCLKAIQHVFHGFMLFEAHYPEIGFRCLAINCPSFFNLLMMMTKQILAPRTYDKICVYGNNREEWEQACREFIDEDQLSKILKLISL